MRRYPVARVYSSDLNRGVETAAVLAQELRVPHETRSALREFPTNTAVSPPAISGGVAMQPVDQPTFDLLEKNVAQALDEIAARGEGSCSIVVAHSGSIRAGIRHLLELPLSSYELNPISYAGFVVLTKDERGSWRTAG